MCGSTLRLLQVCIFNCLIGLMPGTLRAADTNDDHVELYAKMPVMMGARLSPDGAKVAFLSSVDGRKHLIIEHLHPEFRRYVVLPGDELDFDWIEWANNDRIVFALSFSGKRWSRETRESRLFSVSSHGQDMISVVKPETHIEIGSRVPKPLPPPQIQDRVVDWLPAEPDSILLAIDGDLDGGLEVRKVDITNAKYKNVTGDSSAINHWMSDRSGEIRLGYGYVGGNLTIRRRTTDGEWHEDHRAEWWHGSFQPLAFTEDPALVYALGTSSSGLHVVYTLNLDTGDLLDLVFEDDQVDAEDIVIDDSSRLPVGVSYTRDYPAIHYFDSTMSRLQASVDKALAGRTNQIASTSANQRQVLILSRVGSHPGEYYLWDRDAGGLSLYSEVLPHLTPEMTAPTKAVAYKARDGLTIPAYLTIPNGKDAAKLPTVILPHGGPGARDDATYWFLSQFLVSRGYAVLQPNFRGSSGYGEAFELAGRREWGGKMQDDVTDGANWLVAEGIADADRMCIVGWSYGGYAAAMGAVKTPDLYQCAASINGVMNLPALIADDLKYVNGDIWTQHIGLEGEKSKTVSPYHQAERITIPLLIVQAADDSRVHRDQGRDMAKRLKSLDKPVEYLEIDYGGHSMTNEEARAQILRAVDLFLKAHIG